MHVRIRGCATRGDGVSHGHMGKSHDKNCILSRRGPGTLPNPDPGQRSMRCSMGRALYTKTKPHQTLPYLCRTRCICLIAPSRLSIVTIPTWLSPEDYSKGEPFMLEKISIFARAWLPLCAASQLAQRGDYMSATIAGWPLFAIRDDESIRAFRNTCRHQNMMIVEKPAGRCDVLQCRYHGWQYGLDGRFIAAPPLVAPADATSPNNHLAPLATTEWLGLIFGSLLDDLPTSMAFADLASAGTAVENQGQKNQRQVFVHAQTTDVACNWKTFVERRLAEQWTFQWPMLTVLATPGAMIAEQIVPRSFLRTRVVSMVLCPMSNRAELSASAARTIQDAVPQIEAIQHRYENGDTQAIDVPGAHAFRARVRSATRG